MKLFSKEVKIGLTGVIALCLLIYGINYLKVVSIFYIFCFIGSALVGYFRGTGKVHIPFWCSTSHITIRVFLSYLLVSRLGLPAVGLATGIGWVWAVTY